MARRDRGSIYRVKGCRSWIVAWRTPDGKRHVKSSGSSLKGDAVDMLETITGDIRDGKHVTRAKLSVTFGEAANMLERQKKNIQMLKSYPGTERRIRLHLMPHFGRDRAMVTIDEDAVERFIVKRQGDTLRHRKQHWAKDADGRRVLVPEQRKPVSNAEINRETSIIGQLFKAAKLPHCPTITRLPEAEPRQGFFVREEIDRVCAHLDADLSAVVMFAFFTGWRLRECLDLTWDRVSFADRGRVWLTGSMTKNGKPREFVMTASLRELLEKRDAERVRLKKKNRIVAHVFTRTKLVKQPSGEWKPEPGQRIIRLEKALKTACAKAGLPGGLFHDFRRSAVVSFTRSGISESVAMKLSGHLTRSVFDRYNIKSNADLLDAADKLDTASGRPARTTEKKARVHAFRRRA